MRSRAYLYPLDPKPAQVVILQQHAGTARWAYNFALAAKKEALRAQYAYVEDCKSVGIEEDTAWKEARAKIRIPTCGSRKKGAGSLDKARVLICGVDCKGTPVRPDYLAAVKVLTEDIDDISVAESVIAGWAERAKDPQSGVMPWAREIVNCATQHGMQQADVAWKNWIESKIGKRKGPRIGQPKFHKKGSKDSFYIANTKIARVTDRRIKLGHILGEVRTHASMKQLRKAIDRGGKIKSATVSRKGHRWFVAVLVDENVTASSPTRRQRTAGTIGVDLGVSVRAALSTGETVPNLRLGKSHKRAMLKAAQDFSRTQKGSRRRGRAARRIGKIKALEAQRRATATHTLTKRLATCWERVAIEDLHVKGMTASAKGTTQEPGKQVRQKSGLNREILDTCPGEFRRQLTYKTEWYGSELAVVDRWFPSSKTCSQCGTVKAKLSLRDRVFVCDECGHVQDRDVNAARNIATHAVVASGKEETLNERGEEKAAPEVRTPALSSLKR